MEKNLGKDRYNIRGNLGQEMVAPGNLIFGPAMESIAETFEHVVTTCVRMNLDYIFFPEKMLLLDIDSMTLFDKKRFKYL